VSVTASIPYSITLRATFHVCTPTDSGVNNSACVDASHGWQDIDITFAAFYQLFDIFSVSLMSHFYIILTFIIFLCSLDMETESHGALSLILTPSLHRRRAQFIPTVLLLVELQVHHLQL
jgi:hypothetical protein